LEEVDSLYSDLNSKFEIAFQAADSEKLSGWRNELLKVRAEEIKMDLYCVPCK